MICYSTKITRFPELKTEPVLNFNYMRKQKIWRKGNPAGWAADVSVDGHAGLGNLFTQASVALECRWGFASTPDPIGLSMHYVAALQPENPQAGSLYATLSACGLSTILIHSVFLFNSVKTVGALYLVWLGILSCMIFRIKRYLTTGPTRRILNTISGSVLIAFGIKLGIQRS